MKKSCCIDDVNKTPRSSSCSMLLRSACSHGHSHKHSVTSRVLEQETNHEKKLIKDLNQNISELDSSEKSLKFNSYLRSSLKQLAYKSAKTYSVLKEGLYNHLELSGIQSYKIVNGDEECKRFKELHSNQELTATDSFLNNNSISQKECNFINNNYIKTSYSEIMSKTREFSRRSLSSSNALSESESEESVLKEKMRKRSSRLLPRSTVGETESLINNNSNHITTKGSAVSYKTARTTVERISPSRRSFTSSSNVNYPTPPSSYMHRSEFSYSPDSDGSNFSHSEIDISTVQYSPVDKFRWFLWRSIYLKIIKCVNFDVWILSRLQKYKKSMVLLFLLPLLMYLLFGAIIDDSVQKSPVDLSSNIISLSSYIYSSVSNPFIHAKEVFSESSSEKSSCSKSFSDVMHVIYLTISNFFSNIVKKISELISIRSAPVATEKNIKTSTNKDEIKSVAVEVLEEKLNDIIIKIQTSQFEKNIQDKRDNNIRNLKEEIANLHLEFKSLMGSVQKLEKDIIEKSEGSSLKYSGVVEDQSARISSINTKLENFEEKLSSMNGIIKNCCDEKLSISDFATSFEKYFLAALKNVVEGDENKNTPYYFFNDWLNSKLNKDKVKLSEELKIEFEKMKKEQKFSDVKLEEKNKILVEKVLAQYIESLKENLTSVNNVAFSEESSSYSLDVIQKIVKEAIMLYDADKTGLVDYALESGGGSVLSTRCSESYAERDGTISVLGFPLWTTHNSPRTAIQPNMQPGQCWAFKGSHGFLVIQLSYTIYPSGFTLEHIPVSLSPTGSIDSAPKDFSVWGLVSEKDNEGKLLGKYTYDQNGDPLQYFAVQNTYKEPFSFVELKILSNHGNLEYTCLYRFRVHGKQMKQYSTS